MNEGELKEGIEKGCGDNHSWTDMGESFFRKCNDLNKYNIEGKIIGKCKPKFCAMCRLQTIPLLKAQLKTLQERNAEVKQAIKNKFDGAIQGTKKMDYYPDMLIELKKELLQELGLGDENGK